MALHADGRIGCLCETSALFQTSATSRTVTRADAVAQHARRGGAGAELAAELLPTAVESSLDAPASVCARTAAALQPSRACDISRGLAARLSGLSKV